MISTEDRTQKKPALFVISCGEDHSDLRTAMRQGAEFTYIDSVVTFTPQ